GEAFVRSSDGVEKVSWKGNVPEWVTDISVRPDDGASLDQLVEHCTWIARRLSRRYPSNVDHDSLYGAALEGLTKARNSWDPMRAPFIPYAVYCMRKAMQDASRTDDILTRGDRRAVRNGENNPVFVDSFNSDIADTDGLVLHETLGD